jgi:hypothetical protein
MMDETVKSYDNPAFSFDLSQNDLDEYSILQTISGLKHGALRRAWVRRKPESK